MHLSMLYSLYFFLSLSPHTPTHVRTNQISELGKTLPEPERIVETYTQVCLHVTAWCNNECPWPSLNLGSTAVAY